jgi:hypothetical protein
MTDPTIDLADISLADWLTYDLSKAHRTADRLFHLGRRKSGDRATLSTKYAEIRFS